MGKLVLHLPNGKTRDIPLDRERLTIGRRADNDLCLPYPPVSAEHAVVVTVLEDSFLQDLDSTNGTLVNGQRVNKHFLLDHDAIDVGRVQLVYLAHESESVNPVDAGSVSGEAVSETVDSESESPLFDQGGEAAERPGDAKPDAEMEPADNLLAELMGTDSDASVAVDMPPTISVVPTTHRRSERPVHPSNASAGVFIEVMSGPNAGQISPMTKREFVLGMAGATVALIRREGGDYRLVPVASDTSTTINGQPVEADGVSLAFGDVIEVVGVKLLFARRA